MYKEELHGLIEKRQVNVCQICAYKNNQQVYSDSWNNYKEDDSAHIMSVTKSIMALLIGIAVDKGKIKSIDDKVLDYFGSIIKFVGFRVSDILPSAFIHYL